MHTRDPRGTVHDRLQARAAQRLVQRPVTEAQPWVFDAARGQHAQVRGQRGAVPQAVEPRGGGWRSQALGP